MSIPSNNKVSPRLEREIITLKKNPPQGISCYPFEDSKKNVLSASIVGTKGSPYEKGVFQLEVIVTARYPFEPPQVRFITPLYHPNVDAAGRICLDLLKMPPHGGWKPTFTIESLLIAIQYLLANPNPDDPLMPDIASQYKYDKDHFNKEAEKWTVQHACSNAVSSPSPLNVLSHKSDHEDKKRKSSDNGEDSCDTTKRPKVD